MHIDPDSATSHDDADDTDGARPGAAGPQAATAPRASFPILTPLQARVVAVLYEKQHTVPDTYPMSLNALRAGVNQKTSRDPLMSATEAEIAEAIDELRGLSLVIESSGSRTMRYEQNIRRVVDMPGAAVALLATLVLRGPQTAAELRMNSERLYRFADTSSVEGFLREMAERAGGALVRELQRRPGERERRWAQLWTGAVGDAEAGADDSPPAHRRHAGDAATQPLSAEIAALRARVEALERTVAQLVQLRAG
ncbi:MAG: YceH family protein [Lautropia sp.]